MDMQGTKVPRKLELFLNTNVFEVLVSEYNDTSFGDQQGKVIPLLVCQLGKLQASDLGADNWGELGDLDSRRVCRKEIRLVLFSEKSAIIELERLQWREACCLIVDGKVLAVLVLLDY